MFIGLIEWDSSEDPTIIVGPDPAAVRRDAVRALTWTNPETHSAQLVFDADDDPDFVTECPLPDLDDPEAVREWLEAMREALTVPWFSLYAPEATPIDATPSQLTDPGTTLTYRTARPVTTTPATDRT